MRRWAALSAAGALALLAGVGAADPAWAVPTTEIVQGDVLHLVSVADWDAASSLLPGEVIEWDVSVSADAPEPGVVQIGISAIGDASLIVDVSLCAQEWGPSGCPSGATVLESAWDIPRDGDEVPLTRFTDAEVAHLRLAVALGGDARGSTDVRVHAHGAGESIVVGPDGALLATTGMSPVVPWILGGGGVLVVLGLLLVATRRRRDAADGRADDGGEP